MDIERQIFLLNRLLANYFVLYIKLHRYLWYIKGEQSLSLLKWLKEKNTICKQQIDQLVELILVLEGRPFATMEKYIKEATIEEASADDETTEMIQQIIADTTEMQENISKLMEDELAKENRHVVEHTLSLLEYELLKIQQECKRFFK